MSELTQPSPKENSPGAQLAILLGVTALLAVCAYLAYAKFIGNSVPIGKDIEVGAMQGGFGRGMMRNRPRNIPAPADISQEPDGIKSIGVKQMRVKAGDYFTQLPEGSDIPDTARLYTFRNLLDPEDARILDARTQLVMNTNLATQLQLTKEQIEKLSKIPVNRGSGLRLEKADREELKVLWKAFNNAPAGTAKDSASEAILAQIKVIGDRCIEPTKQMMHNRTEQIKAILMPEQLQKYLGR